MFRNGVPAALRREAATLSRLPPLAATGRIAYIDEYQSIQNGLQLKRFLGTTEVR
jgi:hypothetical protein